MKVFEIIPGDFFSVLVSPNREIYVDALMKLYEMFQNEINIRLKAFLTEVEILLEDRVYIIEEGDDAYDAEPASLRGKARLIERRFEKTGWVEREFLDGSFTEIKSPAELAGQEVVLGVAAPMPKGPMAAGSSNPFMPKRPNRSKGPPPR